MNLRATFFAISLCCFTKLIAADDPKFVINLKDPNYSTGVLKTECGGVITAPGLRIQAKCIEYTNKILDGVKIQHVKAEGDLMMVYQGRIFVGECLEFDLLNCSGTLTCGRTQIDIWYLGGDEIALCPDGSFNIYGGFVTTCHSENNPWEITSDQIEIDNNYLMTARDVKIKVLKIPVFFFPIYKSDLKRFWRDSPIKYRLLYDKGLGPKVTMRYRFLSTETMNAFLRFDYRFKVGANRSFKHRGPGGAIEADYRSLSGRTTFITRNYGALDKIFPDENGSVRYRFQGILKSHSEDDKTRLHIQWDRLSDDRMVSDFPDKDFVVKTEKATYLQFSHYSDINFAELTVRPRINSFQTLNQELPSSAFGVRPFEIWKTGIISENYANASFLDYTFVNQLDDILKDRRSGRLETMNTLYRPFTFNGINATPRVGLVGIFYSQSPEHQSTGQLVYTYGGDVTSRLSQRFCNYKHTLEPYLSYLGYTRPQTAPDDYFVFDIHDGYARLDQLRFGLRNLIFSNQNSSFLPAMKLDLYGYAFFGANSFDKTVPRISADLTINRQNWAFYSQLAWNLDHKTLDVGNANLLYTLNSALAFGAEFRYRSKFYWRKAIYDNYVVDFDRSLDNLLLSPLSDRRNTFLTKMHIRFSPRWNMHLAAFHGWNRIGEPPYTGAKVEFFTTLTCNWQFNLTYEYMPNQPFRLQWNFKLIK